MTHNTDPNVWLAIALAFLAIGLTNIGNLLGIFLSRANRKRMEQFDEDRKQPDA